MFILITLSAYMPIPPPPVYTNLYNSHYFRQGFRINIRDSCQGERLTLIFSCRSLKEGKLGPKCQGQYPLSIISSVGDSQGIRLLINRGHFLYRSVKFETLFHNL